MKRAHLLLLALLSCLATFNAKGQVSILSPSTMCASDITPLTGDPAGGTWTSDAPSVISITSAGIATGVTAGTATIYYFTPTGTAIVTFTVNPLPAAISGSSAVCTGAAISLTDATPGGTWSSSDVSIGTIDVATGLASGVAAGSMTISYTLPTGCAATKPVTVNASPTAMSGPTSVCAGATATYTSSPAGGLWTTSNMAVGTVNTTGTLTGLTAGTTAVIYILTSVSCVSYMTVTVNATTPGPITGPTTVCVGGNIALAGAIGGGTWNASNANATVSATGVVTGVTAGTVTIIYSATGPCGPAAATTTITVTGAPAAIGGASIVCTGLMSTMTHPTPGGTWSSSAPALGSIDAASGMLTGVAAGTITVSYSLPGGCVATRVITVSTSPSAISGTTSICVGGTSTLTATPGGGAWISATGSVATIGSSTGVMTGVATGTTSIFYILGGCLSTTTAAVGATAGSIGGLSTVCVGSAITLATSLTGGTWSASNANVTVSGVGIVTGVNTGTVTITYSITGPCGAAITTYPVTVNAAPAAITGTGVACMNSSTTLAHTVSGGTWSSATPAIGTVDAATGMVSGLTAGTVVISYTLPGGGCVATRIVTINPLPSISGTATVCTGSSTTLTGSPTGGTWVSGTTAVGTVSTGGAVTGIAPGTTTIYYILGTGCVNSTTVTVGAGSGPAGPISGPAAICIGSSIGFTGATPGGTWSASNANATVSAGGIVTGANAGTVTITYTLSGACGSGTATRTVTVNAVPTAIAGPSLVCVGASITLSDAVTGGTWASGNTAIATAGSSTGIVTGISAGTVGITYNIATCNVSRTITVNPAPSAIGGSLSVCVGATTTLTSSTPGGTWSSSSTATGTINAATGVLSGIATGTTTISYTLSTGCASTAVVTVGVLAAGPITGTPAVCVGSTTTLAGATGGGTWSASNANATVSATGVVIGVTAGTVTMTYTISGACGTASATRPVTVNPTPSAITGTATVCVGATTTFASAPAGGTWASSNTAVGTISTAGTLSGIGAGTTTIIYTLPAGCTSTVNATVGTLAAGPITGTTTVCAGSNTALAGATGGGTWSASNANATVSAAGVVTGVTAGTVTITYILSGSCGVSTAVTTVTVNAVPGAIAGPSSVCTGATITLSDATAGGIWASGSAGIATIDAAGVVSGLAAGTATITYTLGTCFATKGITVDPTPLSITGTTSICAGSTTTLISGTPGGTWSSSDVAVGSINAGAGTMTGVAAGTTLVSYTLPTGCASATMVTVNPMPAAIGGTAIILVGSSTTLISATPGGTWSSTPTAIATIDAATGVVTGVSVGSATISYILGSCMTTFGLTVMPPMSANALEHQGSISIYPNPATDHIIIGWAQQAQSVATLQVNDVTGRQVYTSAIDMNAASGHIQVSLPGIKAGVYLISITSGATHYRKELVIQE